MEFMKWRKEVSVECSFLLWRKPLEDPGTQALIYCPDNRRFFNNTVPNNFYLLAKFFKSSQKHRAFYFC